MGKRGPASRAPGGYGYVTKKGYRRVYDPVEGRLRMEHVLVWEAANGPVPAGCCIHHENEDKLDNRLENLRAVTHLDHKRMHSPNYRRADGGWEKICPDCQTWLAPTAAYWYLQRGWPGSYCRPCWVRRVVEAKRSRRSRRKLVAGAAR